MKINTSALVNQQQLLDVVDALEQAMPELVRRDAKSAGQRWIFQMLRDDRGLIVEVVATSEPLQ